MTPDEIENVARNAASHPVGSRENPIRSFLPSGSEDYLRRLRGPDGKPPSFRRLGSRGTGPYGNILDEYEVVCASGSGSPVTIFIDMYHHFHEDNRCPAGFVMIAST